jgi:hypothetical protein
MRELGRIVHLSVQVAPLKRGDKPHRWYDATRIRRVDAVTITEDGVVGHVEGEPEPLVDVHNRTHPSSRHRGDNGISLGVRGHYELMRSWYGARVTEGIAGENLVIDRDGRLPLDELTDGVTAIGDDDAELVLGTARDIEPCVEFSRFLLGDEGGPMREPLQQLRHGIRGFNFSVVAGAGTVLREGDVVFAGTPD